MRARLLPLAFPLVIGCAPHEAAPPSPPPPPPPPTAAPTAAPPPAASKYDALDRRAFNQLAVRMNLPVFWAQDANGNKALDPDEVRELLFYPTSPAWVRDGKLSTELDRAYSDMLASLHAPAAVVPPAEAARRALVLDDLDQARPTLVYTDLRDLSAGDRAAARSIVEAAREIDRLYAIQTGMAALAGEVPADDVASQSLFRRNWGPKCKGPKTEKNPACSAIPGAPKRKVGVYPAKLQDDPKFCEALEKDKDSKALLAPFVVVREREGHLVPVKYSDAYAKDMQAVAAHLDDAAAALGPDEKALAEYLTAAAKAFRDNDWEGADEAWSKMAGKGSKFYLRIAPDETYWEPCSRKAGFHVSFARMNQDSFVWQAKLSPHQQEMEAALAKLIGPPYKERKVSFKLPEFIDVVLNAGDSRAPFGATIGQSLPNWGKVANESRGRTVAMANLYTDPDSLAVRRDQARSLLDGAAAAYLRDDAKSGLLSTVLHEATHNLGPSHEYTFHGKTDSQALGGGLASMMEELKAQSGALYYLEFLVKKGLVSEDDRRQSYVDSVVWGFGHIAQGMTNADGTRKPYSQLAAIQLGILMEEGAVVWDASAKAANGTDTGAFALHFEKFPAACEKLMRVVAQIKARGDKKGAEALAKSHVEGARVPQSIIAERVLRFPKNSFVYSVDL